MHIRRWPVLGFVALLGCGAVPPSGSDQPNACTVHADYPHLSSTGLRKGLRQIIGKGWFRCERVPGSVYLVVKLQEQTDHWGDADTADRRWTSPQANKKYFLPAVIGCRAGTFRTAAQIEGKNDVGDYKKSDWTYSPPITNPCAKKEENDDA